MKRLSTGKKVELITISILLVILLMAFLVSNRNSRLENKANEISLKETQLSIMKEDLKQFQDSLILNGTKDNWEMYEIHCIQIKDLERDLETLRTK